MRLKGKIAVITGAGSGIGRATAVLFASEGARVICVDVDEKGGKETVEIINQGKQEAFFIQADVSNLEQVLWAMVTRARLDRQIHIIPHCHAHHTTA